MPPPAIPARQRLLQFAYLIVAIAACLQFCQMRFLLTFEYTAQASIEKLTAFEADCPFQYRVLVPILLNVVPAGLLERENWRLVGFEFVAAIGTVLVFRQWLLRFFDSSLLCSLLSLLVLPCLHYTYVLPRDTPLWFPSDIPSVFFFTVGVFLLYERRWLAYYPVFVLATLNRETSCFLTVVCALAFVDGWRTRRYWGHLAAQTAIWIAIKGALFLAFRDNGGQLVYAAFEHNLEMLMLPTTWPALLATVGFTGVLALSGYPYLEDRFVRRALLVIVPFGGGMFVVGRIMETRIYGELIPVTLCATILIAAGVHRESVAGAPVA